MSSIRNKIIQLSAKYTSITHDMAGVNTKIEALTNTFSFYTVDVLTEQVDAIEQTIDTIENNEKKLSGEFTSLTSEYLKIKAPDMAEAYKTLQSTHQTCAVNIKKYREMMVTLWQKLESSLPPEEDSPMVISNNTTPRRSSHSSQYSTPSSSPSQNERLPFMAIDEQKLNRPPSQPGQASKLGILKPAPSKARDSACTPSKLEFSH